MARHGSIAEQLRAAFDFINAPEGPVEPLQSNWSTTPDDNKAVSEEVEAYAEQRLAMRPTVSELMREVTKANDPDYPDVTIERNSSGQIVSIGRIKFADGTITEKDYKRGIGGDVVQFDRRMPTGAILGTKEKTERALGGEGFLPSNKLYTIVYGGKHPNKPRHKPRKQNPMVSKEEERAILAAAYANTPVLPPIRKAPDGFPWKPSNLRELFVGFERAALGESAPLGWQDITVSMVNRETWTQIASELSEEDKQILQSAASAKGFADIGSDEGKHRTTRIRSGKRRLNAANDNLMNVISKLSA